MLEEEIKQLVCHKCRTNLGLYRRADRFWCGDCLWAEIERLQAIVDKLQKRVVITNRLLGLRNLTILQELVKEIEDCEAKEDG